MFGKAVGNEQFHILLVGKQNVTCYIIYGRELGTIQKYYIRMQASISRGLSLKNTGQKKKKFIIIRLFTVGSFCDSKKLETTQCLQRCSSWKNNGIVKGVGSCKRKGEVFLCIAMQWSLNLSLSEKEEKICIVYIYLSKKEEGKIKNTHVFPCIKNINQYWKKSVSGRKEEAVEGEE